MIVRRLTQWLTQLCTSLTARLRHPAPAAERQTISSGVSSSSSQPYRGATSGTTGRWLDDAHRLRPRIVPHTEQTWNNRPPEHRLVTPADVERAQSLPSRSRPIHATGDETPVPAPPEMQPTRAQPAQPALPSKATPSKVGNEAAPVANESGEIMDVTLRRRLRSLQFLVRHGVYNEGFTQQNVPEQYRLSLGLDDLDRLFEDE